MITFECCPSEEQPQSMHLYMLCTTYYQALFKYTSSCIHPAEQKRKSKWHAQTDRERQCKYWIHVLDQLYSHNHTYHWALEYFSVPSNHCKKKNSPWLRLLWYKWRRTSTQVNRYGIFLVILQNVYDIQHYPILSSWPEKQRYWRKN